MVRVFLGTQVIREQAAQDVAHAEDADQIS